MPPRDLSMRSCVKLAVLAIAAALLASAAPRAFAQDAQPATLPQTPTALPAAPVLEPLPQPRRTQHALALPGRTLAFSATVGAIPIAAADGRLLAEVGTYAYTLDGAEPRERPVVFAFNGGPGSSSVWLHLGSLGPWRVPLSSATMAEKGTPPLLANAETWLEFADLVFIDPPGTGHSRIAPGRPPSAGVQAAPRAQRDPADKPATATEGVVPRPHPSRAEGGAEWFWSLNGDIETLAEVIVAWLRRSGRVLSPVVLAGESYGGFRGPLVAHRLATEHRQPVRALVLVSPVLDFDGRRGGYLPQHYTALLPSLAATDIERSGGEPTRAAVAAAEAYARGDYLVDLVKGPRDPAAVQRIADGLAPLIGLPAGTIASTNGRINARTFLHRHPRLAGRLVSLYDAGMPIGDGLAGGRSGGDPFTTILEAPLTRAMDALNERLEWNAGRSYRLMSFETTRNWIWRNTPHPPESLSALQTVLRADTRTRALVAHGFTDLVTPYFATATQLGQMPFPNAWSRITFEVYPGGHMFYSRDNSRARFRDDARRLIGAAIGTAARTNGGEARERETP